MIYNFNEVIILITYEPLWKTLQKKSISQYSLIKNYGFSTGTLDSLRQNKNITMKTLNDICNALNCNVESVIKHIPDEKREEQ